MPKPRCAVRREEERSIRSHISETLPREAIGESRRWLPDLMFVDIGMPEMTGYDVARTVRRDPTLAGIRLVALTGYGREQDQTLALEAGFDQHLTKPVTNWRLHAVLEDLCARV